jgi:hypothetical protein
LGEKFIGSLEINRIYQLDTLEGNMRADFDDWIITGVNGEMYPCKPNVFEKTYEPIEE